MQRSASEFDALVDREFVRLVRGLTLYCGDWAVAEELAQDAFARAYERWDEVSHTTRPGAWVQTVAFNLARSGFRRRLAERRAYARHGVAPEVDVSSHWSEGVAVRAAVAGLPARQREVIVHRYFLGRSVAETADLLGVSQGAVKAAAFKAVAALRTTLEEVDAVEVVGDGYHR